MKPIILKTPSFTLAVLQLNFKVGDIPFNAKRLLEGYREAIAKGATFVMAPELAISGYPPKDNLLHTAFVAMCKRVSEEVAAEVGAIPLAFGTPWPTKKLGDYGQKAYNRYVVACNGKIVFFTDKVYPAQGGVFDEHRVHVVGKPKLFRYQGLKIGFPICEDIWHDPVVKWLDEAGADIFLVPNGSPTYVGKPAVRQKIVARHAKRTVKPMLYLNHVGGQDEHAFDGGAFFVNPASGKATVFAPYWQEAVQLLTIVKKGTWRFEVPKGQPVYEEPSSSDYILDALVLTTRDYLLKSSSLRKVIIGISGGVDSAVVLGLAVLMFKDMGLNPADHIIAVSMPSKHNSETTKGFAQQVCDNFGIKLHWWPIGDAVESLKQGFESHFEMPIKVAKNAAYENTQSRERGQVLMMLSNRLDALLLSTGNKSEMAMGYATLYGDMNGGFNPLKTLYKTQVYELGHTINKRLGFEAIPHDLIHQRPSAELDDNQFDENSLPPYAVLDAILMRFMDEKLDVAEIMESGNSWSGTTPSFEFVKLEQSEEFSSRPPMQQWWVKEHATSRPNNDTFWVYYITQDCVKAVAKQLLRMRFKRYQACPGVTITRSSLDDGEKYPIANSTSWLLEGTDDL